MEEVLFFLAAAGAFGGALAVIALRNPFYSVLALIVHLISLAGLFLILYAEFIAAAQIVVYAGAVMVLYLFVTAYVGGVEESIWEPIPAMKKRTLAMRGRGSYSPSRRSGVRSNGSASSISLVKIRSGRE